MNDTAERASSGGQEERQTHSKAQAVSQAHKERAKGFVREALGQGEGGKRKSFVEHIRAYGGRGGGSPDQGKSARDEIKERVGSMGSRITERVGSALSRAGGSRITERINSARSRAGS